MKKYSQVLVLLLALVLLGMVGCDPAPGFLKEVEPNNDYASSLSFQNRVGEGEISTASDKDYWRLKVETGKRYEIFLRNLEDDLQLMMYTFPSVVSNWGDDEVIGTPQKSSKEGVENEVFTFIATDDWNLQFLVETIYEGVTSYYRISYNEY